MKVGVPKEVAGGERRVAITPDAARALIDLSLEVGVESGAGLAAGFADADYEAAGATVEASASEVFSADLVLKVAAQQRPSWRRTKIVEVPERWPVCQRLGLLLPSTGRTDQPQP